MIYKFAKKLSERLVAQGLIESKKINVCIYGLQLLFSSILSTLSILIIGCVLGKIIETLSFLVVFIVLRGFCGGFHAKTYVVCTVVTLGTFCVVLFVSSIISLPIISYVVLLTLGLLIMINFAPIEHPNKKISEQNKRKHKKTSTILFCAFCLIGALLNCTQPTISTVVYFSLVVVILLMLFAKILYRREEVKND